MSNRNSDTLSDIAVGSDEIDVYVKNLRRTPVSEKTEHTDRGAIRDLLDALSSGSLSIINEPKRVTGKGAPDFKISSTGQIVGYVETKPLGTNLDLVMKSEQLARYRQLSGNILLTNYLDWVWIRGTDIQRVSLAGKDRIFGIRPRLDTDKRDALQALLRAFLSTPPKRVASANDLAKALADRSRLLRDFLDHELQRQEKDEEGARLYGLYKAFRDQISAAITLPEFADAFAQTLAYGLFLAKLTADNRRLTLVNAKEFIPKSFKLIQELVGVLDELEFASYSGIRWVVDEILSIINGMDVPAVRESLSFRNRKSAYRNLKASSEEEWRLFSRDPFVYFYEDYLAQYDSKLRKRRGVYYTPPPIVNFIVRGTDDLLRSTFRLADGLGDPERVTVLDFACGTGTFVVEIVQRIMDGASSPAKANRLLRDHVLKNVRAFEYLIAPYTIAHLKLSQYFEDRQLKIGDQYRFNILLTNTLEPLEPQRNYLLPALSEETARANEIRKNGVLVITGNPPYAGHSLNQSPWITDQVRKYREGIPELSKPGQGKWLQNDYVKFIRFAQYEMDRAPEGLVAIITDNSYLDNPTFRGMRRSLMATFDQIYIVDLHGNANKKERAPDGSEDENVFDIKQGVSIAFFLKRPGVDKGVWHADVWGKRQDKYRYLTEAALNSVAWRKISPAEPGCLFTPVNGALAPAYKKWRSVPEIFAPMGDPAPGIVTTHDEFAISFTPDEAEEKVARLLKTRSEEEARSLFRLCRQKQWSYDRAKKHLKSLNVADEIVRVLYQPFDERWTVWDSHVAVHRRERVMQHMLRENVALSLMRKADVQGAWHHVLVAADIITHHTLSMKEVNYLFPLYLYPSAKAGAHSDLLDARGRIENLAPDFRAWLDKTYAKRFKPEAVLGYIYAVLHAPSYRERYCDHLRMDFPRIPFPAGAAAFEALSKLGRDLVAKHLLQDVPKSGLGTYRGVGSDVVEKPRYSPTESRLYLNGTQYFDSVTPDVWSFQVGGYQVLAKYLKNRKGRLLTASEIANVEKVVNVLSYTVAQMKRIDAVYRDTSFR
jgi:SAM-dependent methyltransferase